MKFEKLFALCIVGFLMIAAVAVSTAALSAPHGGQILFADTFGATSNEIIMADGVRLSFDTQQSKPEPVSSPSPEDMVDINNASVWELSAKLPGIGDTIAARIVEYRELIGGFRTVDDLIEVKGIGESKLEAIRPYCYVGDYNG